jgi:hypothetical protein
VTETPGTSTPTATPTGTLFTEGTPTPTTPTATATSTQTTNNNNSNHNSNHNDNNGGGNDNNSDGGGGNNDNFRAFRGTRNDNTGRGNTSTIPGFNYPGVLNTQPGEAPQPPVLSSAPQPQQPSVAVAQPPLAVAQPPRPIQTPSVLPVAGQLGTDLPRLATLAGLGLVASGLGLRLRERLFGGRGSAAPATAPEYETDVADTYLDDRM